MRTMRQDSVAILIPLVVSLAACHRLPSNSLPRIDVWFTSQSGSIVLDSASFRPVLMQQAAVENPSDSTAIVIRAATVVTVTSYQGSRYHPETIRAIADDSLVRSTTARSIADLAKTAGVHAMLDFLGGTPNDLPQLVDMTRSIGGALREAGVTPVAIVVPAGDTVSYPTAVLARIADLIVIRLNSEHRDGTAPGPLATPEFIARALGMRAEVLGPGRIAAELPLYGYRWDRTATATSISFAEARALVASESGVFRRDQASQFLTASGRDGWTVWVPDARTVEAMIAAVTRRGVAVIVLSGMEGADPGIPDRIRETIRR